MAAQLPGHAADSPSNTYVAPGRFREAPGGWLAAGHRGTRPLVPGDSATAVQLDYQARSPAAGASLAAVAGSPGPLADAVVAQGRAHVASLNQMHAANPALAPQLGANAPSGLPGQPPVHTAPINGGQPVRPRPGGPPAMEYTRTPGELRGPLDGGAS